MATISVRLGDIVPYSCVFIDAAFKDLLQAIKNCFACDETVCITRSAERLEEFYGHPGLHVLPCLSVRTAFDLFLSAADFQVGSEIIMSAINIPAMEAISRHHGLIVVPLDVDIETMEPKFEMLLKLITERTVLILLAHIYGSVIDVDPFLKVARDRGILVAEDCAESFNGLDCPRCYLGNPKCDASFHSFGIIKRRTCFGGAIARVKGDRLFKRMVDVHETYERQTNYEYLQKLIKYVGLYMVLNVPLLMRPFMRLGKWARWDYQKSIVHWMRSFKHNLILAIRRRLPAALLLTMSQRLGDVAASSQIRLAIAKSSAKRALILAMLPQGVVPVGRKANVKLNWLFPVTVEDPAKLSAVLNHLGISSFIGATQLQAILPAESVSSCCCSPKNSTGRSSTKCHFPHDAKYLMDHVVYLPVHQNVPDEYLRVMGRALRIASEECSTSLLKPFSKL